MFTDSMKLFMAALALQATYTSLFRCSARLIAKITLESGGKGNQEHEAFKQSCNVKQTWLTLNKVSLIIATKTARELYLSDFLSVNSCALIFLTQELVGFLFGK